MGSDLGVLDSFGTLCELDCTIIDDGESCNSFKYLPFNLIRSIFLFDFTLSYYLPSTQNLFDSFVIWLSENEVTEEQKEEIVKSFNFEDFTLEELLNEVKDSGLYSAAKIDKRVRYLVKKKNKDIIRKDVELAGYRMKLAVLQHKLEDLKRHPRRHY